MRLSLILSDGPPGIGCPVISSLSGASFAVIVTEPTPSGRHDLERISDLCRHFKVPVGIVINKFDIHDANTRRIQAYCEENGFTLLGKIPHDPAVTDAIIKGQTITEYQRNGIADDVRRIWENIENVIRTRAAA
jgi:MinD superfamily P-loop ATPase